MGNWGLLSNYVDQFKRKNECFFKAHEKMQWILQKKSISLFWQNKAIDLSVIKRKLKKYLGISNTLKTDDISILYWT
jgi:hypothetical protein